MNNVALWQEYKANPDSDNKKKIIVQYLNLVHYVIQNTRLQKYDIMDEKDFYQFGIEGLSEAIERFDPDYGTKFETYAIQRIRGKIIDELRKIQIKPRKTGENDVVYKNLSLSTGVDDEGGYLLLETIPSDAETPDETVKKGEEKEILFALLKKLNERDRLIITLYYYESLNYKEIAEVLNITVSRVSQIHTKILQQLKNNFKSIYGKSRN
ncbi:MAG TPA: sigma-70 family RNA polymerase sigma factor [Ignavibacteriaceae bacterium]|jgi:RNA polymerase sigma factor for flagellar operon FliA|nr:sigma-70 family RNA polymerase sigma factor [Ignavibacteriaceae bacterium]